VQSTLNAEMQMLSSYQ